MFSKIPNYIKFLFTNFIVLILFNFIFRVLFFYLFADLETATSKEIQNSFLLGLRFDIKLASLIMFPLVLLVLIIN